MTNVSEAVGTPEKRSRLIRYLMKLSKEGHDFQREVREAKELARRNDHIQRELPGVKDDVERIRIERQLNADALALADRLERRIPMIEDAIGEGKHTNADIVFKSYRQIEKAYAKEERKKRYDLKELFYLLEFIGPRNKDDLHKVLKGKILRYQNETFHIEGYFYRMEAPHIKFAEIDELIPFKKDTVVPALDKKVEMIRRGLIAKNDVLPEHVLRFIMDNQALEHGQLLERLKQFRVKSGMHAAHIDGIDIGSKILHYQDYPADVWIPLSPEAMRKAIAIRTFLPSIESSLKKTYIKDIEHALKGIDENGKSLSQEQYDQLTSFGMKPNDVKVLKIAKSSLVVRHH